MRDRYYMRPSPDRRSFWVPALGALALLTASCSSGSASDFGASVELTSASDAALTDRGVAQVGDLADTAPLYRLTADVEPATGQVEGTVTADLPVGDADVARLRYFPALVDPAATVTDVEVSGEAVSHELDSSLLTVPLDDRDGADRVELTMSFAFTVPEIPETDPLGSLGEMLGDEALQPANIGLIGRKDDVVNLGHWFPIWVPDGLSAEPTPEGFGDIGNFPAAVIEAEIEEPSGWTVVTGGVRQPDDDATVVEAGSGLRDLSIVLVSDAATVSATAGDTTVRVVAPGEAVTDEVLDEVLAESVTSLETLSDSFGPYPWEELDVVATPLGSGVGGMEYPGVVWIESSIFAGGLPGMGDMSSGFGDLEDLNLEGLDLGFDDLEDLDLDELDLGELDIDELLEAEGLDGAFDEEFGEQLAEMFDALAGDGESLDAFEDLEGLEDLEDLEFGDLDGLGEGFGDLDLGGLDLGSALDPDVLSSTRAWTIAHEVAHQWWHAVVGNDSITSPIVDEPLAQYSSCLVFQEAWPETAEKVCDANLAGSYEQMRAMGVEDAPAARPSDDFDSMLQYSGVVYGKAPLFYRALEDQFGTETVVAALAAVVDEYGFAQASSEDLRTLLGETLADPGTVDMLWTRWLEESHGDDDILE